MELSSDSVDEDVAVDPGVRVHHVIGPETYNLVGDN